MVFNLDLFTGLGTLVILLIFVAGMKMLIKQKQFKLDEQAIKHPFLLVFIEWLISMIFIFSLLRCLDSLFYTYSYHFFEFILSGLSGLVLIAYVILLLIEYKNKIEMLFLIVMIPLGILFMFFIFPDYVPDEQSHFMRAFSTSTFDFSGTYEGYIYGDYAVKKITDIHTLLNEFYLGADTTLNVPYYEACSYSFVTYLIPSIVLLICRLLHFSIYLSYYCARMSNFFVFLFFGYQAIRIIPKCKWILFVVYFNPVMIQQGMSLSSDVIVNSLCIFSIAYCFYLYKKQSISSADIVIVFALIAGIAIIKYAYLPVFGCYFLLFPNLIKMSKRNWGLFIICGILAGVFFYISILIKGEIQPIPVQKVYFEQEGVNSEEQLSLLLEYPGRILLILKDTINAKLSFYIDTFCGRLGWLDIFVNQISQKIYFSLLFFATFLESSDSKPIHRIWIFFIGILTSILLIIGLLLTWTGVGKLVVEGVQGRYFIPVVILFLIAISNSLLKKFKYKQLIIISAILLVNFGALFDLMQYWSLL